MLVEGVGCGVEEGWGNTGVLISP